MNKKLVSVIAFSAIAFTNLNPNAQAQTKENYQAKSQLTGIGNKQANLRQLFYDNIEKQEKWAEERPIREAQERARIDTGLVGKWIYSTTNRDGDHVQVKSWIRSDGTILYYLIPDRSQPVPLGGHVLRPYARSTWGYENGIFTENSERGTTSYQLDAVSQDEIVFEAVSSNAGVNSGTQYTYRKSTQIGANIPK